MTASLLAYAVAAYIANSCPSSAWQKQILPILQGKQQRHPHTVPHARQGGAGGGGHSRGRGGGGGMTASLLAYAAAAHAADSCHNSVWQQQILPILQGEQQQHLHTVPHARN